MPNLSEQDYLRLKALVDSPESGISDAVRERALKAIGSYQEQYETGMRGGLSEEQALAMGPPTPENDLVSRLNPSLPLVPQALAIQPATTHPDGDEAAKNEWIVQGEPQKGTVYVYEPPLDVAKKELLANPQIAQTLFPNVGVPFTAEEIAGLTKDSEIYQAYADYKWRQYAEQAAKDGKTAYRYSKAPWLHEGNGMSRLGSFGTKALGSVAPLTETFGGVIMGVDDATMFGAGAASESPMSQSPMGDERRLLERMGGPNPADEIKADDAKVSFEGTSIPSPDEIRERAPGAFLGGQVLGTLRDWGPSAELWNFVRSGGQRAAARATSRLGGLAARTAAGAGAASVAASAEEGIKGLVAGEGLPGAAQRAESTLLSPFAPLLGAGGELLGSGAHVVGEATRHGGRYGGAPGRLEAQGVEFKFGGPTAPAGAREAVQEGRRLDVAPQDVRAKELAPKLEEGASAIRTERAKSIGEQNEQFYGSREGQMRLPVTNVVETVTEKLRSQYQRDGQRMQPIAGSGQKLRKFRGILNENIGSVSLEPVEGAIELSTEEAGKFLSTHWKRKLIPDTPPPKGGGGGGARNVELVSIGDTPDLAREQRTMNVRDEDIEDVAEAAPRTEVQSSGTPEPSTAPEPPGRDTPTRATPNRNEAIREYGNAMAPGREARSAEAKRMEKLAAEGERGPITIPPERGGAGGTAAEPLPEWKPGTGRVYISDLYERAKGKFKSREEFNRALLATQKSQGGDVLKRIDLAGAADSAKMKASHVQGHNSDYHLIDSATATRLLKDWGIAGGVAAAASAMDEEDAGTAAAAAGFVSALRKKGADKVYLVPRRSNARDHETLIHNYNPEIREKVGGVERTYEDRDLADIRDAAYRDRDARPMNGKPGGWSESQRAARESLREAEDIQKRVGHGDRAFSQVVDFAGQHPGQLLNKEALEAAAQRSGVREQLDAVRALDPWRYLQNNITYGREGVRPSLRSSLADAAYLRGGYPAVRRAENPQGLMRGGKLGRFSLLRGNSLAIEDEEQKP